MYYIKFNKEFSEYEIYLKDGVEFGDELIFSFDTLKEALNQLWAL